jgi:uncharacterized protein YjbJ (UPF0337 family)
MPAQTTHDQIQARLLCVVGALELSWGRLIGNESLRARGERDRRLGRMWQEHSPTGAATMHRRTHHWAIGR